MSSKFEESTRERYGKVLARLASLDSNVVALDCDLGKSTHSYDITQANPERFIEMGIAEQDMVSTAVGLATTGKIVFANTFAVFLTGRAYDQIRQQVALPCTNVKLCGSSAGITQGPDGATHQSVEDISLMRTLPNLVILVPADGNQTERVVFAAYEHSGPVYIRLSRFPTRDLLPRDSEFQLGRANILREGTDVALISTGPILKHVIDAGEDLHETGVSVGIYNFHTIKPLDLECVQHICATYRLIVTVEEHGICGGLGSAVAEVVAEIISDRIKPPLYRIGLRDTFGESGTANELLHKYRLDTVGIVTDVISAYKRIAVS